MAPTLNLCPIRTLSTFATAFSVFGSEFTLYKRMFPRRDGASSIRSRWYKQ